MMTMGPFLEAVMYSNTSIELPLAMLCVRLLNCDQPFSLGSSNVNYIRGYTSKNTPRDFQIAKISGGILSCRLWQYLASNSKEAALSYPKSILFYPESYCSAPAVYPLNRAEGAPEKK